MFIIKIMTSREEGYRSVATTSTENEARAWIRALKIFNDDIIDIYYTHR